MHREDAVGQQPAVGVGQEERGGLAGHAVGRHVDLGEADPDPRGVRAGVPGDLLPEQVDRVGDVTGPGQRFAGVAARVPVHVDEVDLRPGDGEHGLVPGARIVTGGQAVRPVGRHGQHRADLDGGVDGLHRLGVGDHQVRVVGSALVGMVVGLPAGPVVPVAVVLVADRPVPGAVPLRHVGVAHPVGGLGRRAGAVVRDDHRLGADPPRRGHEGVEVGAGSDVAAGRGVVAPVIDVGVRAAGVAHHLHAGGSQQVRRLVGAQVLVPDGVVDAECGVGHGGQPGPRVHGDGHRRGRRADARLVDSDQATRGEQQARHEGHATATGQRWRCVASTTGWVRFSHACVLRRSRLSAAPVGSLRGSSAAGKPGRLKPLAVVPRDRAGPGCPSGDGHSRARQRIEAQESHSTRDDSTGRPDRRTSRHPVAAVTW